MTIVGKIGLILLGVVLNAITVFKVADYVVTNSLAGFQTSQATLSASMVALQGSLDQAKLVTDDKVAETKGELTAALRSLTEQLGANSRELASLNATLAGMDKRLSDSISQQQAFQRLVMQRIIFDGPLQSTMTDSVSKKWLEIGYDPSKILMTNDVGLLKDWGAYIDNPPK